MKVFWLSSHIMTSLIAIFFNSSKSPGLDGMSAVFFQQYSFIVVKKVTKVVQEVFLFG